MRAEPKTSSCKFPARTHKGRACFSLPTSVQKKLGIPRHGTRFVKLVVDSSTGHFEGKKQLKSGSEIYGTDINKAGIKKNQVITVEAFPPHHSMARRKHNLCPELLPSEAASELVTFEGGRVLVQVSRFERDPRARKQCISKFGTECSVCGFDFGKKYGEIGKGFIHVHHLRPLATRGKSHRVDAGKHLRPVCPNCHEMLHKGPPFSIKKLKTIISKATRR